MLKYINFDERIGNRVIEHHGYYLNDHKFISHREGGPALIQVGKKNTREELWCVHNIRHREDGPALVAYYPTGELYRECWYINDRLHRFDGPASIWYRKDGSLEGNGHQYHINGVDRTKEIKQWLKNNEMLPANWKQWDDEQRMIFKLFWS